MISIITGSYNRLNNIKRLISNTVDANNLLELVIVDGGSTDGTVEYLQNLNNKNIKFINYGKRSSYPHFSNLAIQNSKFDYICQWDDDALLINGWDEVIETLNNNIYDFHIFNWKLGNLEDYLDPNWLVGNTAENNWNLEDKTEGQQETEVLTMNYGIYNKKIFKEIGMYNTRFNFWYADGDLSNRAYHFGYKHKSHRDIKVFVFDSEKNKTYVKKDLKIYQKNLAKYKKQKLTRGVEYFNEST
jgi:glycosyltransferase involved in cell wall biosynthesis